MVQEITDETFKTLVDQNELPAVIDFWAPWCGPCKIVGISMDAMQEEYEGRVVMGKVDVDSNPELTARFGIRNMPTVLYIKNGRVVDQHVGATTKQTLVQKMLPIL